MGPRFARTVSHSQGVAQDAWCLLSASLKAEGDDVKYPLPAAVRGRGLPDAAFTGDRDMYQLSTEKSRFRLYAQRMALDVSLRRQRL